MNDGEFSTKSVVFVYLSYRDRKYLFNLENALKISTSLKEQLDLFFSMPKDNAIPVMYYPDNSSLMDLPIKLELFCHVINGEISLVNSREIVELILIAEGILIGASDFLNQFQEISDGIYFSLLKNNYGPSSFGPDNINFNSEFILSDDFIRCNFSLIWPLISSFLSQMTTPKEIKMKIIYKLLNYHGWNAKKVINHMLQENHYNIVDIESVIQLLIEKFEKNNLINSYIEVQRVLSHNNMDFIFSTYMQKTYNFYIMLKYYSFCQELRNCMRKEKKVKSMPDSSEKEKILSETKRQQESLIKIIENQKIILKKQKVAKEYGNFLNILKKKKNLNQDSKPKKIKVNAHPVARNLESKVDPKPNKEPSKNPIEPQLNFIVCQNPINGIQNLEYSHMVNQGMALEIISSLFLKTPKLNENNLIVCLMNNSELLDSRLYSVLKSKLPDAANNIEEKIESWKKSMLSSSMVKRTTFKRIKINWKDCGVNTESYDRCESGTNTDYKRTKKKKSSNSDANQKLEPPISTDSDKIIENMRKNMKDINHIYSIPHPSVQGSSVNSLLCQIPTAIIIDDRSISDVT